MSDNYKGYRVPKILIGYAVKYYFRYKLSLRDVQDIMWDRGLSVSHQSISNWIRDFGPLYAQSFCRMCCVRIEKGLFSDFKIENQSLNYAKNLFKFGTF